MRIKIDVAAFIHSAKFVSADEVREPLLYVEVGKHRMVAADGRRMMVYRTRDSGLPCGQTILVKADKETVSTIKRIGGSRFGSGQTNWIEIEPSETIPGVAMVHSSNFKQLPGFIRIARRDIVYPKWRQVITGIPDMSKETRRSCVFSFNPWLMSAFGNCECLIFAADEYGPWVVLSREHPNAFGVIMPCRSIYGNEGFDELTSSKASAVVIDEEAVPKNSTKTEK